MTTRKLTPGTPEHREAIYRAACAYQDGLSLEAAARQHRVNPQTLRHHMLRNGWVIHTNRRYTGRPTTNPVPDALLDAHPRLTPRQIADACGVSLWTVRTRLRERGTYQPRPTGQQPETAWRNSLRNRDRILRCVQLRDAGLTRGQISIRLNTPPGTISTWLRKYDAHEYLWQRRTPPGTA